MARTTIARPSLIALLTLLAAAAVAVPAQAALPETTYYQCTIQIGLEDIPTEKAAELPPEPPPESGWHDCSGVVTVTTNTGIYRVARVDLSSENYKRLDVFVNVCSPTGWWSHVADSPTCDGYGGDYWTTDHDAEAYILGTKFEMFGTYNYARSYTELIHRSQSVTPASGCYRVQWTVYEDRVFFDNDGDPADSARVEVRSIHGFESAPYNEADSEDPSGSDANLWYVGLNRTVYRASRSGTGVNKACFVVSTTISPSPSVLSALCP